jgi:hypothetical protein
MMLGESYHKGGRKPGSGRSFKEFLQFAPPDSPYRADAVKVLRKLGESTD